LEILEGLASGVSSWTEEKPGADGERDIRQYAKFKIDERSVRLQTVLPPRISDGDRVRVAGYRHGDELRAKAYLNFTTGQFGTLYRRWLLILMSSFAMIVLMFIRFGTPASGMSREAMILKILVFGTPLGWGIFHQLRNRKCTAAVSQGHSKSHA